MTLGKRINRLIINLLIDECKQKSKDAAIIENMIAMTVSGNNVIESGYNAYNISKKPKRIPSVKLVPFELINSDN